MTDVKPSRWRRTIAIGAFYDVRSLQRLADQASAGQRRMSSAKADLSVIRPRCDR